MLEFLRIDTFYFYSSNAFSWERATELLVEVASHGEDTGFEVPCLIVAAKDDLDSFPMAIQNSTRVFIFFSDYNIMHVLLCELHCPQIIFNVFSCLLGPNIMASIVRLLAFQCLFM
jgi:hypothetical protein